MRANGCPNTTYLNNEATECGKGLSFSCYPNPCTTASSGLIKDNYIHDIDIDRARFFCPHDADAEGIAIGHPADANTLEIVANRLEAIGGFAAIIINDTLLSGTGVIEIHRNRIIEPFGRGFSVFVTGAVQADITFHHNLIVGGSVLVQVDGSTTVTGVRQEAFPSGSTEPLKLYNNTVVGCSHAFKLEANNVTLKNNISDKATITLRRHVHDEDTSSVSTHVRDSNCYFNIASSHTIDWNFGNGGKRYDGDATKDQEWDDYQTDSGQEGDSINDDPDLDTAYELQSGSPVECRTGGEALWPAGTLDLNGNEVPNVDVSMGAVQFDNP